MTGNFRFNLGQKLTIKYFADMVSFVILWGMSLIVTIKFGLNLSETLLTGFLAFFLFVLQYRTTKHWAEKTLNNNLGEQIKETSLTAQSVLEDIKKQKIEIDKQLEFLKKAIVAGENLMELSDKTKGKANTAVESAKISIELSEKEQNDIRTNIEKMGALRQKIQIIAELILELSEHTQQIGSTISVVEDITEQTNMLALNAAVEAARAGEHGKGFAVVAGEIRKLADESKQATTKIISLINDIQHATNSTVMATEEGFKEIETSVKLADDINSNIEAFIKTTAEVSVSINDISLESETQNAYCEEISNVVKELSEVLNSVNEILGGNIQQLSSLKTLSANFKENIIDE